MTPSARARRRPALLILDFDGVVADSELLANTLLAEFVSGLGRPTTVTDSIRLFMGKRAEDMAREVGSWIGRPLPETFIEDYRAYSRPRMRTEIGPVAGVADFLEAHRHLSRCVASSSHISWLDHCVDKFGLREAFGRDLYSANDVKHGKPAPDIFLHAAAQMSVASEEAVVIEDSPAGIQGGKAAGMTVVGFLGGSHILDGHRARLVAAGADHIVEDYAALAQWLAARA